VRVEVEMWSRWLRMKKYSLTANSQKTNITVSLAVKSAMAATPMTQTGKPLMKEW
jgi:hypothetical protein